MAGSGNVNGRVLLLGGLVLIFAVVIAGVLAGDSGKDGATGAPSKWQHLALSEKVSIGQVRSAEGSADAETGKTIVKLGQEGWELVCVANFSDSGTTRKTVYYFKRPF